MGVIAQQDTNDLQILLRRMTKDRDASIRLRAIEAILKWEERQSQGCAACAARAEADANTDAIIAALTPIEHEYLAGLFGQIREAKAEVYARLHPPELHPPELPPQRPTPPPESVTQTPEPELVATMQRPATTQSTTTQSEPIKPYELPREHWDAVGLFKDNGIVTHALGDEHAQKILTGEISFEDARAAQEAARRHAEAIAR